MLVETFSEVFKALLQLEVAGDHGGGWVRAREVEARVRGRCVMYTYGHGLRRRDARADRVSRVRRAEGGVHEVFIAF